MGERLTLGEQRLRIDRVIALEPDRGSFFNSLAPRVLMAEADLEATGLIGPGSRVRYKLLLAGDAEAARAFTDARRPRWTRWRSRPPPTAPRAWARPSPGPSASSAWGRCSPWWWPAWRCC
ncbi:MAG: hypothetical protein U5L11_15225 [Arhodomonas sp.]|nr:hypothetical protein [Arhodomonas sp.]